MIVSFVLETAWVWLFCTYTWKLSTTTHSIVSSLSYDILYKTTHHRPFDRLTTQKKQFSNNIRWPRVYKIIFVCFVYSNNKNLIKLDFFCSVQTHNRVALFSLSQSINPKRQNFDGRGPGLICKICLIICHKFEIRRWPSQKSWNWIFIWSEGVICLSINKWGRSHDRRFN